MFTPEKIAAALIAVAALAVAPSAAARVNCRPHDAACLALHGPSTAAERERTRALNRESLEAAAPAPQAGNGYARGDNGYARDRELYRRDMREYRQAQRRYEQAMRRGYRRGPPPRLGNTDREACRALASAPRRQPGLSWSEQAYVEDHEAFAPTGGKVDPSIAAPVPGLSGATTGLPAFNAKASGVARNCAAPRRTPRRY